MLDVKLLNDNSEDVLYNFDDFPIRSKEALLSYYPNLAASNHWHDDFEFTIILKGKMTYSINGKNYEFNEGEAIFVNSKQMHYGFSADGSDCKFICILVPPSLFSVIPRIKDNYLNKFCADSAKEFLILNPSIIWHKKIIDMLVQIHNLCKNEVDGFELQVLSLFYSIIGLIYTNTKHTNSLENKLNNKKIDSLHTMVGFIQNNYKTKITLNEIASAGNVCRSSCCNIFQSILNKSPIAYLTEYRLEKSIELLNNNLYSITEIALQCGFNSSSYFTEIFRQNFNCTPSVYRKNILKLLK